MRKLASIQKIEAIEPIEGADAIERADILGGDSQLANIKREGIVIRPIHEATDPELGRLSFKVINPDFLLKWVE